jgi:hypothetical protein
MAMPCEKSPANILWVRAFVFNLCQEDPLKMYKNNFATELDKWCLHGWLLNMVFFYALYIQKEQIAGPQNDHALIVWVRALVFILCKEDPLKLYKNEFSTELHK